MKAGKFRGGGNERTVGFRMVYARRRGSEDLIWGFIVIAKLLNSCVHSQSVALGTPIARNQPAWTPAIALRAEKECKGAGTSLLTSLSVVEKRVLL